MTQQTDSVKNISLIHMDLANSKDQSNIMAHNATDPNQIEPLITDDSYVFRPVAPQGTSEKDLISAIAGIY